MQYRNQMQNGNYNSTSNKSKIENIFNQLEDARQNVNNLPYSPISSRLGAAARNNRVIESQDGSL